MQLSMIKYALVFSAILFAFVLQAQPFLQTMKHLPGTGQTKSYTNTFGEDADYNYFAPYLIANANGTVLDTVTGLLWQQTDGGELTVENAQLYCDTLTLGGFTDWRLPKIHELFSIHNLDRNNPSLNTSFFTKTAAEYWWSSDRQVNDATKIWVTNAGGGLGNHAKSETVSAGGTKKIHVRAVRDLTTPKTLPQHFIDNGNGTTLDASTGLTWLKVPQDSTTWENALIAAEGLSYAGYSDWRLPNIKELHSINDESLISPSISKTYFPGVAVALYWSSTSLPNQVTNAWYLDTRYGITTYAAKTRKLPFFCVRGGSVSTALSPELAQELSVSIFPNPSASSMQLEARYPIENILVSDTEGRVVFTAQPNSTNYLLNCLTVGSYVLRIQIKGTWVARSVMVQ